MRDPVQFIDQLMSSGSAWIYGAMFAIAFLEGLILTTFLISGTIVVVLVGSFVARGTCDAFESFAAVYVGTILGDVVSYYLGSKLPGVLGLKARIKRFDALREPLKRRPFVFTIAAH